MSSILLPVEFCEGNIEANEEEADSWFHPLNWIEERR